MKKRLLVLLIMMFCLIAPSALAVVYRGGTVDAMDMAVGDYIVSGAIINNDMNLGTTAPCQISVCICSTMRAIRH